MSWLDDLNKVVITDSFADELGTRRQVVGAEVIVKYKRSDTGDTVWSMPLAQWDALVKDHRQLDVLKARIAKAKSEGRL